MEESELKACQHSETPELQEQILPQGAPTSFPILLPDSFLHLYGGPMSGPGAPRAGEPCPLAAGSWGPVRCVSNEFSALGMKKCPIALYH